MLSTWVWKYDKLFLPLKVINGKSYPYRSKGIPRSYHYRSDPKVGLGIVAIIRITRSCHDSTTILSLPWYSTTKEAFNQPRYGRVYNCKHPLITDSNNNWITINFQTKEQMKYIKN